MSKENKKTNSDKVDETNEDIEDFTVIRRGRRGGRKIDWTRFIKRLISEAKKHPKGIVNFRKFYEILTECTLIPKSEWTWRYAGKLFPVNYSDLRHHLLNKQVDKNGNIIYEVIDYGNQRLGIWVKK